jgi:hypothetical protein
MTLATILAVICLASAWPPVYSKPVAAQSAAASSPQTQTPSQTPPAVSPAAPSTAKPPQHRRKKSSKQDCGTAPGTTASSAAQKSCPPPKVIVRNGGTSEPTVELKGKTSAEQASNQRSTEQLTGSTEENLSKIAGQTLTPGQQELVTQIRQFLDQSKSAIAAGDPDRGHNLAIKAHLLSEELIKP